MIHLVYSTETGLIKEVHASNRPKVINAPEGFAVKTLESGAYSPYAHKIDLETLDVVELVDYDPPATWEQIKSKRNALEVSPITLDNGLTYDYDQQAKLRFETALSQFDNLPTLVDGKLTWKLSDNSFHPHTKAELQAAYDELQAKTAIRAAQLFLQAEILAAGNHTVADIEDLTNWGL